MNYGAQKNEKTEKKNKIYPEARTRGNQNIMSQNKALACLQGRQSDGNFVSQGTVSSAFLGPEKSKAQFFVIGVRPNLAQRTALGATNMVCNFCGKKMGF